MPLVLSTAEQLKEHDASAQPTAAVAGFLQDTLGQRMTAYLAGLNDVKQIGRYRKPDGPTPTPQVELRLREGYKVVRPCSRLLRPGHDPQLAVRHQQPPRRPGTDRGAAQRQGTRGLRRRGPRRAPIRQRRRVNTPGLKTPGEVRSGGSATSPTRSGSSQPSDAPGTIASTTPSSAFARSTARSAQRPPCARCSPTSVATPMSSPAIVETFGEDARADLPAEEISADWRGQNVLAPCKSTATARSSTSPTQLCATRSSSTTPPCWPPTGWPTSTSPKSRSGAAQ